jgi:hypothetical protein
MTLTPDSDSPETKTTHPKGQLAPRVLGGEQDALESFRLEQAILKSQEEVQVQQSDPNHEEEEKEEGGRARAKSVGARSALKKTNASTLNRIR